MSHRPRTPTQHWHPYERALAVSAEDIEFTLRPVGLVGWANFLLNPRRLRGSDFLMRWSQGRWSEERVAHALEASGQYFAVPYGPSGTAPEDVREFELYFERLDAAGLGDVKRPDLLVFAEEARAKVEELVSALGGTAELPFTREDNPKIQQLLRQSLAAVECENSLWKSKQMPAYGTPLTPQRRLGGKLGVKKTAVLPTVIIKEEDREPLSGWQTRHGVPIHVWHVFYDQAFGLSLTRAEELVKTGLVEPTVQVFQAPGGATTRKTIFKFPYQHAYHLGDTSEEPTLIGAYIEDRNGHVLPYVHFEGGALRISDTALTVLAELKRSRGC